MCGIIPRRIREGICGKFDLEIGWSAGDQMKLFSTIKSSIHHGPKIPSDDVDTAFVGIRVEVLRNIRIPDPFLSRLDTSVRPLCILVEKPAQHKQNRPIPATEV